MEAPAETPLVPEPESSPSPRREPEAVVPAPETVEATTEVEETS